MTLRFARTVKKILCHRAWEGGLNLILLKKIYWRKFFYIYTICIYIYELVVSSSLVVITTNIWICMALWCNVLLIRDVTCCCTDNWTYISIMHTVAYCLVSIQNEISNQNSFNKSIAPLVWFVRNGENMMDQSPDLDFDPLVRCSSNWAIRSPAFELKSGL